GGLWGLSIGILGTGASVGVAIGWGKRGRGVHFCCDRGQCATVSGARSRYPGTSGRGGPSAATLRLLLGSRLPRGLACCEIGRERRGKKGKGERNETDPSLCGLCHGSRRLAGAAGLGLASESAMARRLVSAPAPPPLSARALCQVSATAPYVASGSASSPGSATKLRVVSASGSVPSPAPRVVPAAAACLVSTRLVSAPAASLVPAPAHCL